MGLKIILLFVNVLVVVHWTDASRILAVFPTPSKSHTILGFKLAEGLLKRGHHVTFVSPFQVDPKENLTRIELKSIYKYKEKMPLGAMKESNPLSMIKQSIEFMTRVNELFWEEPEIQKIIEEKPKFDVVIPLAFLSDAMLGLGPHLGAPTILFNCVGTFGLLNSYLANPTMVYSTNPMFGISTETFWGRLGTVSVNMLASILNHLADRFNQGLLDKHLPNSPPIHELKKNISIMLTNSHVSIEPARPYVPNMIQIGGFHVQETKPLPQEFKTFLDDAKHGAILFCMGSNVKISLIPEHQQKAIFKVLGEMAPMKVIFKSELKHENVPKNIMVKSWIPQADILAHPNTKLFISHGGLGGNTESVYHGVPILGIPFFGDQATNMQEAQTAGYALVLNQKDITEELFRNKLKEMLNNPKYAQSVERRSALMREQPVTPMENAAFWIEHVIKFGGGGHLKNQGAKLSWFQLYMVDIYVFYTVVLILLALLNFYVIKIAIRMVKKIFGSKKKSIKPKKVKKS
ncbi:UDP-glycosyltransferase UGT5-like [Coccinella septempunctata]|uniref:UDP-glycosyltransferase UGT5-like n=1 Tax=Coccinella septempunctata TaxID=41139 RepID=UPI001D0677DA|nr:UDP-glycosyltransferase UGT5-like [Coccinella septempunctata]